MRRHAVARHATHDPERRLGVHVSRLVYNLPDSSGAIGRVSISHDARQADDTHGPMGRHMVCPHGHETFRGAKSSWSGTVPSRRTPTSLATVRINGCATWPADLEAEDVHEDERLERVVQKRQEIVVDLREHRRLQAGTARGTRTRPRPRGSGRTLGGPRHVRVTIGLRSAFVASGAARRGAAVTPWHTAGTAWHGWSWRGGCSSRAHRVCAFAPHRPRDRPQILDRARLSAAGRRRRPYGSVPLGRRQCVAVSKTCHGIAMAGLDWTRQCRTNTCTLAAQSAQLVHLSS